MTTNKTNVLIQILFVIAVALKPLYLRNSGGMQLSDLLFIAVLLLLLIVNKKIIVPRGIKSWITVFFFLVLYQFLIGGVWQFVINSRGTEGNLLYYPLFYLFNLLVAYIFIAMYCKYGIIWLKKLFINGITLSSIVCAIGLIVNRLPTIRQTGFFNNPNQLGYYAVIIITVVIVFWEDVQKLQKVLILTIGIFSSIVSLSKAALLGTAVVLVVGAIFGGSRQTTKRTRISAVFLIIVVFTFLYVLFFSDFTFLNNITIVSAVRRRMFNIFLEKDSGLLFGRGYARLGEIDINVFFGVGEGAFSRFQVLSGVEVHSLYISLIVSYGIVGFVGYMYLILKPLISRKTKIINLLLFLGILFYGFTHNGIRNTLLWGFLTILLLENNSTENKCVLLVKGGTVDQH